MPTPTLRLWGRHAASGHGVERVDGAWKLAELPSTVAREPRWPALCKAGRPDTAPVVLAPFGVRARPSAGVRTGDQVRGQPGDRGVVPFAPNGFLSRARFIDAQFAEQVRADCMRRQPHRGSTATTDPMFALALANVPGHRLQGHRSRARTTDLSSRHAEGQPSRRQPRRRRQGQPSSITRPIPSSRPWTSLHGCPAGGTVALDGFVGWPLTAAAS